MLWFVGLSRGSFAVLDRKMGCLDTLGRCLDASWKAFRHCICNVFPNISDVEIVLAEFSHQVGRPEAPFPNWGSTLATMIQCGEGFFLNLHLRAVYGTYIICETRIGQSYIDYSYVYTFRTNRKISDRGKVTGFATMHASGNQLVFPIPGWLLFSTRPKRQENIFQIVVVCRTMKT